MKEIYVYEPFIDNDIVKFDRKLRVTYPYRIYKHKVLQFIKDALTKIEYINDNKFKIYFKKDKIDGANLLSDENGENLLTFIVEIFDKIRLLELKNLAKKGTLLSSNDKLKTLYLLTFIAESSYYRKYIREVLHLEFSIVAKVNGLLISEYGQTLSLDFSKARDYIDSISSLYSVRRDIPDFIDISYILNRKAIQRIIDTTASYFSYKRNTEIIELLKDIIVENILRFTKNDKKYHLVKDLLNQKHYEMEYFLKSVKGSLQIKDEVTKEKQKSFNAYEVSKRIQDSIKTKYLKNILAKFSDFIVSDTGTFGEIQVVKIERKNILNRFIAKDVDILTITNAPDFILPIYPLLHITFTERILMIRLLSLTNDETDKRNLLKRYAYVYKLDIVDRIEGSFYYFDLKEEDKQYLLYLVDQENEILLKNLIDSLEKTKVKEKLEDQIPTLI